MYGSPPISEDHPSQSLISDFTSQQSYNILRPGHPRREYSSYHVSTTSQFPPTNPTSFQFQGNMDDSMDDTGSWPVGNLQSQDGVRHQAGFVYPTPHGEAGLHASFRQHHEPQSHSMDPFSWTIPGGPHFQGQMNEFMMGMDDNVPRPLKTSEYGTQYKGPTFATPYQGGSRSPPQPHELQSVDQIPGGMGLGPYSASPTPKHKFVAEGSMRSRNLPRMPAPTPDTPRISMAPAGFSIASRDHLQTFGDAIFEYAKTGSDWPPRQPYELQSVNQIPAGMGLGPYSASPMPERKFVAEGSMHPGKLPWSPVSTRDPPKISMVPASLGVASRDHLQTLDPATLVYAETGSDWSPRQPYEQQGVDQIPAGMGPYSASPTPKREFVAKRSVCPKNLPWNPAPTHDTPKVSMAPASFSAASRDCSQNLDPTALKYAKTGSDQPSELQSVDQIPAGLRRGPYSASPYSASPTPGRKFVAEGPVRLRNPPWNPASTHETPGISVVPASFSVASGDRLQTLDGATLGYAKTGSDRSPRQPYELQSVDQIPVGMELSKPVGTRAAFPTSKRKLVAEGPAHPEKLPRNSAPSCDSPKISMVPASSDVASHDGLPRPDPPAVERAKNFGHGKVIEEVFPPTDESSLDNIFNDSTGMSIDILPGDRDELRTYMSQCRYNDIQGMVNGFFFRESPSTINFGFRKILPDHTPEQKAKIMKHNIRNARKLMGTGTGLPFADDKKKGRFRGRVFGAIVIYLIRKVVAIKGATELDMAPAWVYRYALVLIWFGLKKLCCGFWDEQYRFTEAEYNTNRAYLDSAMNYFEQTPEMIRMRLESYHRVIGSDLRSLTLSALAALTEPRIDRREVDVKDVCQRPRRNTW